MIISHRHKFIFLHCRKAAGSSVVVSLTRYLGWRDIQLSAVVDCARAGVSLPIAMTMGSFLRPSTRIFRIFRGKQGFYSFVSKANKARFSSKFGPDPSQATAKILSERIPEIWNTYYKFCVIRNPWDKTVSDYFWRIKSLSPEKIPTFPEYIRGLRDHRSLGGVVPKNHDNWDIYTIDDHVAVDNIIRFEDLQNGLIEATKDIGLDWDGWLPHTKQRNTTDKTRQKRAHYQSYYSDEDAEIVGELYCKEIEYGGYRF